MTAEAGPLVAKLGVFVNDKSAFGDRYNNDEARLIADGVAALAREKLTARGLDDALSVELTDMRRGCIIVELGFFLLAGGAFYKGVKDYPKLKQGVQEIARDVNGLRLRLNPPDPQALIDEERLSLYNRGHMMSVRMIEHYPQAVQA